MNRINLLSTQAEKSKPLLFVDFILMPVARPEDVYFPLGESFADL
jgi:hypothetical protein